MLNDKQRQIVLDNLGLVYTIAKRYHFPDEAYDDIIQAGMEGLSRAASHIDEYDPAKGTLSTFLGLWVRQAITDAAIWYSNRSGVSYSATTYRTRIKDGKYVELMTGSATSCEKAVDEDGNKLIDFVARHDDDYTLEQEEAALAVRAAIRKLPVRERMVIRRTYGIDCPRMSRKELADKLGVTPTRYDHIRMRALSMLRHPRVSKSLRDYI